MRKRKTVDVQIDRGIEMPAAGIPGERNYRFPFRKMEISDSFLVPECLRISSFWATAARMGKLTGMRIATRPLGAIAIDVGESNRRISNGVRALPPARHGQQKSTPETADSSKVVFPRPC